jgi:hypothetical protein
MADNQKAMENLSKISGKPMPEFYTALTMHNAPQKAPRKPSTPSGIPLEADVSKAVAQYLAAHPNVKFAVRQNSGSAMMDSGRPIWFYRWAARGGKDMRITDFWGMLHDGRMFAIECKRPGWKRPTGQREREQANFIEAVGFGGFVTCVEDIVKLLK